MAPDRQDSSNSSKHEMPHATSGTTRIEAISDGIFAVAMTLLILGIKLPEHASATALPGALFGLWSQVLAFAVSFLISTFFWIAHTLLFESIERSDRTLLWINAAFLMFLVLVPLSTQLIATYGHTRASVVVYGVNIILVGVMLQLTWAYASRGRRLISDDSSESYIKLTSTRLFALPLMGAISICVAYLNTTVSLVIYVVGPILFSLPSRFTPYHRRVS